MESFKTAYGYFDESNREYVITRPDTPRPWVNVICPSEYGLVVSQTGGGYSWRKHASLNRITRWEQDLVRDDWGKYVYVRDDETDEVWSLTWKPTCIDPHALVDYRVAHGVGYTKFAQKYRGIETEMTVFVPKDDPLEVWMARIVNRSDRPRSVSLFTYFEWGLGAAPDWHREFHKVFIDTEYDDDLQGLWATKRLWDLPNEKGQHWNRSWGYRAFHAVSEKPAGHEGDKEAFLGMYGSLAAPTAVREGRLTGTTGRWTDAIGSLHNRVRLEPGEASELVYVLGAVEAGRGDREKAVEIVRRYRSPEHAKEALDEVKAFWRDLLDRHRVETPDKGFDLLSNTWLKYQAVSGRLWGRTAYYQTGGAYGFRDQLQDSLIFLSLDPERTKEQIRRHAAHQFRSGKVLHWWHPISEDGLANEISDNRLWLPYVVRQYVLETGDEAFLDEPIPFYDEGEGALFDHCVAAIDYSLERFSPRGLPLIGGGDWNDGMNAVGFDGRGESVWLGHFLYGILQAFGAIARARGDESRAERYRVRAADLKRALNEHGWDGAWYLRATCDDGTPLGSASSKYGKVFLNAQTWAVIHDVADGQRKSRIMDAVREHLVREYGPVLFSPAYGEPDERIGYLTRYAPGVRENGGLYTHAATWAVMAAAKERDAPLAWQMYRAMSPVYRGMDPDLYKVEPYVTPGNVDGPDSPHFGRGGWTWYTGSAAWFFRVGVEWLLGVRAVEGGLLVDPCIPSEWPGFRIVRRYRGATYDISVRNPKHVSSGIQELVIDGEAIAGNLLPAFGDGRTHRVEVVMGEETVNPDTVEAS